MESSEAGLTFDLFVLSIRRASLGIKYQRRALQDIGFSTATASLCVFGHCVNNITQAKNRRVSLFFHQIRSSSSGKGSAA